MKHAVPKIAWLAGVGPGLTYLDWGNGSVGRAIDLRMLAQWDAHRELVRALDRREISVEEFVHRATRISPQR